MSTGQATSSTSNFHLITDALADYAEITGIDLSKNPFAAMLEESTSPEAILQLLQRREKAFEEYRDGTRRLISCLSPAVKVLQAFSGILGGAVGLVSLLFHMVSLFSVTPVRSPSHQQMLYLLVSIYSLLYVPRIYSSNSSLVTWICQAASGVSSSYDALLDLFECLGNFLKRLEIYTAIPPTPIMIDIIVKIMVQLLSVLALATKQINQGRFSKCVVTYTFPVAQYSTEKFAKKLLGESEIEAVLQRLDRLTQDEARMTVAQTLGVVHGLVGNMKVVMEGAECQHDCRW
jgi:fungal STAND N-terminal Goodbye domain